MTIYWFFWIVFLSFKEWSTIIANSEIITTELCGLETQIKLGSTGESSSVTILLNAPIGKKPCKLNITAPTSHLINLQWHDVNKELFDNHQSGNHHCPLNVFLPDNTGTAVWKGDPCQKNSLPEVDLLTPELSLEWTPPRFSFYVKEKKLVVTAVGQDNFCETTGQHTCMRIGWKPVLCVSEFLVCDGNPNCPKGSSTSDEDDVLCKSHLTVHSSWQQLAEDVIKKLPPGVINNNWLQNKRNSTETAEIPPLQFINWKDLKKFEVVVTTTEGAHEGHHESGDSVSATLSHYGPWGYIMLGMLICGTILMFCGLWECCFRKPKTQVDLQSQHQPTTVLIINRTQDDSAHQPPNYDDLDQPPSYSTLFPHIKVNAAETNNTSNTEPSVSSVSDSTVVVVEPQSGVLETDIDNSIDSSQNRNLELAEEEVRDTNLPTCIVTSV